MLQYVGGKSRTAAQIADVIYQYRRPGQLYIEPFVGAANVLCKVSEPKQGYDLHPELIALLRAIRDGWDPPSEVSEAEYYRVKTDPDAPPHLKAFVGFGCSFGGKYWGGYARNKKGQNYASCARNSLARKRAGLQGAELAVADYRTLEPEGAIIYCDPPYGHTQGYSVGDFDSIEFWNTVREWSQRNTVIVSEYHAPRDFDCIWSKPQRMKLRGGTTNRVDTERLFTLQPKD